MTVSRKLAIINYFSKSYALRKDLLCYTLHLILCKSKHRHPIIKVAVM